MRPHRGATSDLDEAVELFTTVFNGGGLRLSDLDGFRYVQRRLSVRGLVLVQQWFGARIEPRSDEDATLFVAWTDRGTTTWKAGRTELQADAGVLWSGRHPVEADVDHAEVGSITIDRSDFESRAGRLLAVERFTSPDFVALRSTPDAAALRRQVRTLLANTLTDWTVSSPLAHHRLLDHTVALVLGAAGIDAAIPDVGPKRRKVRRAVDFIEADLESVVSLSDIAAAADTSARALQVASQRELGETPMHRLRRLRLARAHGELRATAPDSGSVAVIARRWGFTNLGRFASAYRSIHGELPSETLRS